MRRPARHLFTLCSTTSLLLCVAVCVLWVRSLHWVDFAVVEFPDREVRLWTNPQLLALGLASPANEDSDWDNGVYSGDLGAWHFRWRQPMPGFERELSGGFAFTVPLWCLALGLAILPGIVGVRRLRHRARARDGLCTRCSYDLRATPGRCPECGTAAAEASSPRRSPGLTRPPAGSATDRRYVMRLHAPFRPRHIAIAAGLLLASLIGWAMFERASCRATLAKFEDIQRGQTRDDVHKMLGSPRSEWTGADVLHKLYWGSDVAIGPNEGRVVQDDAGGVESPHLRQGRGEAAVVRDLG